MQLILSGREAGLVDDLAKALRADLQWKPCAPDGAEIGLKAWSASQGDWTFTLFDFPIDTQEGRQPGDRGQNVALLNRKKNMVFMSDDKLFHELAAWLLENANNIITATVNTSEEHHE